MPGYILKVMLLTSWAKQSDFAVSVTPNILIDRMDGTWWTSLVNWQVCKCSFNVSDAVTIGRHIERNSPWALAAVQLLRIFHMTVVGSWIAAFSPLDSSRQRLMASGATRQLVYKGHARLASKYQLSSAQSTHNGFQQRNQNPGKRP